MEYALSHVLTSGYIQDSGCAYSTGLNDAVFPTVDASRRVAVYKPDIAPDSAAYFQRLPSHHPYRLLYRIGMIMINTDANAGAHRRAERADFVAVRHFHRHIERIRKHLCPDHAP